MVSPTKKTCTAFTPLEITNKNDRLRKRQRCFLSLTGFTLLELLLVIIILGILAGVSIPRLRKTFNNLLLEGFSRQLQSSLNYLQQRAIVEGKITSLKIDTTTRKYYSIIKENFSRLKTYHIPAEIKVETEKDEILFYPDGSIDKVNITLTNTDNKSISLTSKGVFSGFRVKTAK